MTDNTMTPENAAALRAPFPPEAVGSLPKPYKKDSPKGNCPDCGQYHGLPAMHLSYVGHAATTDRLLAVDPAWTWEPMATDPQTGAPLMVGDGLWIRLTVCGVTRIGYGDGASVKERIGDAIRNAAMRFGVALDLWSKESLVEGQHDDASHGGTPDPAARQCRDLRMKIAALATEHGWDLAVLGQEFMATHGVTTANATPDMLTAYYETLTERAQAATVDAALNGDATPPTETTPEPEQPPPSPAKTASDYRNALLTAKTKTEVRHILRDLSMEGLADVEVGDEHGAATTLSLLATYRLKELGE